METQDMPFLGGFTINAGNYNFDSAQGMVVLVLESVPLMEGKHTSIKLWLLLIGEPQYQPVVGTDDSSLEQHAAKLWEFGCDGQM